MIYFFTKGDKNCASSRQRAFLIAEEINKLGKSAKVMAPSCEEISNARGPKKIKLIFLTLKNLWQVKRSDVLYLQRAIYNKYLFVLAVLYKIIFHPHMVFDFDDAIFLHSKWKTFILTRLSNSVIVGSHYLEAWARQYNQNVYLVPTSVDDALYREFTARQEIDQNKIVLGWVGNGPVQLGNLKLLVPVFQNLIQKGINFKFVLVGSLGSDQVENIFKVIKGLDCQIIDSLNWSSPAAVPRTLQTFNIGLMPLAESKWSKGKCSFKAVEYMACGVVPVISPVGENSTLIADHQDGFLASTSSEWVEILSQLILHPEKLAPIGQAAQKKIADHYSLTVAAQKILAVIG